MFCLGSTCTWAHYWLQQFARTMIAWLFFGGAEDWQTMSSMRKCKHYENKDVTQGVAEENEESCFLVGLAVSDCRLYHGE
jgi:hypothetical protein